MRVVATVPVGLWLVGKLYLTVLTFATLLAVCAWIGYEIVSVLR